MISEDRQKMVGFVGLAMMGAPMAENILQKEHPLVAYDIDQQKLDHCVGLGAQAGSDPADVAHRASRVVSMVDTTAQAEEVLALWAGEARPITQQKHQMFAYCFRLRR